MSPSNESRANGRAARSLARAAALLTAPLLALFLFHAAAEARQGGGAAPASRGGLPAQKSAPPLVVAFGTKRVSIPAPAGFEEVAAEFAQVREIFTRTEAPENDMLAVHVPSEFAARLRRGEPDTRPTFYTKVSALKLLRGSDVSAADFGQFVAAFRTEGSKMMKADSPEMRETTKRLERALAEMDSGVTKFDIPQTEMLGEIESTPNVHSLMMLVRQQIEMGGQTRATPIVVGMTVVRVRQRLLFLYTYKHFKTSDDAAILSRLTRDWTARVVAANPGN